MTIADFSTRLLHWHREHGRHDLPWQQTRSPYHTWLSEVMLQQTQVATVIPYFERFIRRFPDIRSLAQAPDDDVMQHWAGLGYYSRARNLHKAAEVITSAFAGRFPENYDDVLSLPGIGPSTAGAILAQSMGQRHAILDGNVKRVLCRYHAIEGWPGQREVENRLWSLAERHTPDTQLADYTQAIMDLGATLCKRATPLCAKCPLAEACQALKQDRVGELPHRKPRKTLPVKQKRLLIIRHDGELLLEKRPPSGIWGGLWSLPELEIDVPVVEAILDQFLLKAEEYRELPTYRHTFSHFHLDITPTQVDLATQARALNTRCSDETPYKWHSDVSTLGLAAPVKKLLEAV